MAKRKESVNIDELREYLEIDKHNLDREIQRQPSLFFKVSDAYVSAAARRDFLKEEVSRTQSRLYAKHRRRFEKEGTKATEAQVNASVQSDEAYKEAVDKHILAREKADAFQALKESFHQRSYMLRDLVALHIAGYYERASVDDTSKVKDYKASKAMDRMAEARKAAGSKESRRARKREH